jgi:tetratricopeptide (TPR) repeat protein
MVSLTVLGWWWLHRTAPVAPPVVDLTTVDPAVRRAVDLTRAEVLHHPDSADAWGKLGMLLLAHGFSVEAIDTCLAQAERLDPRQPRWPYLRAAPLLKTDPEAALPKLQRAVTLCDCDPDAPRLQLAELLLSDGRLEEAAAHFLRVLERHPDHARAEHGLGRLAYERGDLSESLAHLQRATADTHTRKAALTLLAQAHKRLGNSSAAEQELQQAAQLPNDTPWPDPFHEEVAQLRVGKQTVLQRSEALLSQGRYAEALGLLQQTVRDYPDLTSAQILLGRVHLGLKDPATAERVLQEAIKREPNSAEALFYLGVVCFFQKKHQEAAGFFRRAVELKPNFPQAHLDLGHCLREQGDEVDALSAFRTAIRYQPGYAAAHVNLGALLVKRGQIEEALVHLRQAVQLNPTDKDAQRLLKMAMRQQEKAAAP